LFAGSDKLLHHQPAVTDGARDERHDYALALKLRLEAQA